MINLNNIVRAYSNAQMTYQWSCYFTVKKEDTSPISFHKISARSNTGYAPIPV